MRRVFTYPSGLPYSGKSWVAGACRALPKNPRGARRLLLRTDRRS